MKEKKVYIEATGCTRRKLETEKLRRYLSLNGYRVCRTPEESDCILFTSCAFKDDKEEYSVRRIQKLMKYGKRVIVYGCLPDIAPNRFVQFDGVSHLAPKDLNRIDTFFDHIRVPYAEVPEVHQLTRSAQDGLWAAARRKLRWSKLIDPAFYESAWLFLKKRVAFGTDNTATPYYLQICRGCRGRCAYCAIPRAIGGVVSLPVERILRELREGYEKDVREFVLLGDDPGCYGLDLGIDFPRLLQELCREAAQLRKNGETDDRIRFNINEIHPKYLISFIDDILPGVGQGRLGKVLCPVQSASNRILERMEREHTIEAYEAALNKLRQVNSRVFLSTQIIAGFPGETEDEYQQSLDFLVRVQFDEVVIFGYDDKANTAASRMDGKIEARKIRSRVRRGLKYLRRHGVQAYRQCLDQ